MNFALSVPVQPSDSAPFLVSSAMHFLTKLAELEKEVKDFVEYKLSAYKVANPTKRSDLLPKSIYAFDIPNEIARVKRYKEYAEYCLKQLEQMQKEG